MRGLAQAEVPPHVVLREVARPALHDARLRAAVPPCAVTTAPMALVFAALAHELDQQPVPGAGQLVAQDLRAAVEVVDHDVEAAVVVEVADGEAAAHPLLGEHGPELAPPPRRRCRRRGCGRAGVRCR